MKKDIKNLGGRPSPSLFTPERCNLILDKINKLVPFAIASSSCGISRRTFYYWLEAGEKDLEEGIDSEKSNFFQKVKEYQADNIIKRIATVIEGKDGWQGSAWILERIFARYFSKDSVELDTLSEKIEALSECVNKIVRNKIHEMPSDESKIE